MSWMRVHLLLAASLVVAGCKDGTAGALGPKGDPGIPGTSVTVTPLDPGTPCANGGSEFSDGTTTSHACNGAPGAQGVPGMSVAVTPLDPETACTHGGAQFSVGTTTALACNGAPGTAIRPIIWSGGCNYHGTAGAWNTYCGNLVYWSTATEYLTVASTGRVTITRPGYYRINFFTISYGGSGGYSYVRFLKNGQTLHNGNNYIAAGVWADQFADITWPFAAGDTLDVSVYNPASGGYAFHSASATVPNLHSGLQVSFIGPL